MNTYLEIAIEIAAAALIYLFAHKQGIKHQRKKTAQFIQHRQNQIIQQKTENTYLEKYSGRRKYTPTPKD
jgi:hypothetical protein